MSFRDSWPSWLSLYVLDPLPSVTCALVFDRSNGSELGRAVKAGSSSQSGATKASELVKLCDLFAVPAKAARAGPSNHTQSARSARADQGGADAVVCLAGDVRGVSEHSSVRVKGDGFVAARCGASHALLLFTAAAAVDFEVVGVAEKNAALIAKHAPDVPPPPDWALEVLAHAKKTPAPPTKKAQTAVSATAVVPASSHAPPASQTTTTTTTTTTTARSCDGCGRSIDLAREAHLKTSVGGHFHPGCLKCATCGTALSGAYAIDDENRAKCASCQPACDVCRHPLRGTYLLLDDGRNVHQECAPQHLCDGCHRPIEAGVPFMTAKSREFHKDGCMKCEQCHRAISEYADIDGPRIVCVACANAHDFDNRGTGSGSGAIDTSADTGVYCHGCRQMIGAGKFVHCLERKFHTTCLKCVSCRTVLTPNDNIYNKDGEPACESCGKFRS